MSEARLARIHADHLAEVADDLDMLATHLRGRDRDQAVEARKLASRTEELGRDLHDFGKRIGPQRGWGFETASGRAAVDDDFDIT